MVGVIRHEETSHLSQALLARLLAVPAGWGLSAWPARLARSSHRRLMRRHVGLMGWHQHGQTWLQTRRKDQGTRRPRLLVLEEGERSSSFLTSRQITRSRRQRVVGARSSTYERRRCVIEQHGLGYASAIEWIWHSGSLQDEPS